MSRQTELRSASAGIEALRLDPTSLPTRYVTPDPGADGGERTVDLFHDGLIIRRIVGGARMKLNLPFSAYRGIAVRVEDGSEPGTDRVELVLVHSDGSLDIPLFVASDDTDVVAECRCWSLPPRAPSRMPSTGWGRCCSDGPARAGAGTRPCAAGARWH